MTRASSQRVARRHQRKAKMRYIARIPAIQLVDPIKKLPLESSPPITMLNYAMNAWFSDPKLSEGGPAKLRRWQKVIEAFEEADKANAPFICVEDADCEMLQAYVKTSKGLIQYPMLEMQLLAFPEAVINAKDKKPEETTAALS
jgi:hypothetical protein